MEKGRHEGCEEFYILPEKIISLVLYLLLLNESVAFGYEEAHKAKLKFNIVL